MYLLENNHKTPVYGVWSNQRQASNKAYPLISAAPLGIHIEIRVFL